MVVEGANVMAWRSERGEGGGKGGAGEGEGWVGGDGLGMMCVDGDCGQDYGGIEWGRRVWPLIGVKRRGWG